MELEFTDLIRPNPALFIYGAAGIGKTRLVLTAEKPIILNLDEGLLSLRREAKIPYKTCSTVKEFEDFLKWYFSSKEAKQYSTLFVDDMTELCHILLTEEKINVKDDRQAYGKLYDKINEYIRYFRKEKERDIVIVCKEDRIQDKQGMLIWYPRIPGRALAPDIPYLFNEIYRMEEIVDQNQQIHKVLRVRRNDQCEAKTRHGLGNHENSGLEAANLQHIFNKIRG